MIAWLPGFLQAPEDLAPLTDAYGEGTASKPRARVLDWRRVAAISAERAAGARGPAALAHVGAAALRECLGEATVWVGYSLGARAALTAALADAPAPADAPAGVAGSPLRALVLVSGSAGLSDAQEREARRALDGQRADALRRDPAAFIDAWGALDLFAPLRAHAAYPRLQAQRRARADADWARDWGAILRDWSPGELPCLRPHLSRLALPTLCVAGALDPPYVAHAKAMAEALPRGRFACVPAAGHALPLESPAMLAGVIRDFLHAEGIDP